jgi:HK97 family phage major capsid protein
MGQTKALSLEERQTLVRQAVYALQRMDYDADFYVCDVYEDYCVIEDWAIRGYWRAGYTIDESQNVTIEPRTAWTRVEKDWTPVKSMVTFSPGLKATGDGKFEGFLVMFGDETKTDLVGDFFTKSTDFDIEDGDKVSIYYNHGYDPVLKTRKIGTGTLTLMDAGVWMQGQLNMRDEYEQRLYEDGIAAGKMGLSSGTLPNLVTRAPVGKAYHITQWPLGKDASVTPTPAEPRIVVRPLKSLIDSQQAATPEAAPEAPTGGAAASARKADIRMMENKDMSDQTQTPPVETVSREEFNALSKALSDVTKALGNLPALQNPGVVSDLGGAADPQVKSLADFVVSIVRGDTKRLKSVYGSTKDMDSTSGASGGFLVPAEYRQALFQIAYQASPIVAGVNRIPVSAPSGTWPALDQYFTPTAGSGNTALAGQMTSAKRAEKGAYTETQAKVKELKWRVSDAVSGYVEASRELRQDSAVAIEALLRQLIGVVVNSKLEYYVLRGSGVGEPLGILNWQGLVQVSPATDNTFAYADALSMIARFKSLNGGGLWLHHQSVLPDIGKFENGTGGSVLVANQSVSLGSLPILGYQRAMSEHLPQANNSGNVILGDLSAYNLWVREELYIDFSEHVGFLTGMDTWRFGMRVDGMPALVDDITLADPQGSYTVSPFVSHND